MSTVAEWRNTHFGLPLCSLPMHSVRDAFADRIQPGCVCVGPVPDFDPGECPFCDYWHAMASLSLLVRIRYGTAAHPDTQVCSLDDHDLTLTNPENVSTIATIEACNRLWQKSYGGTSPGELVSVSVVPSLITFGTIRVGVRWIDTGGGESVTTVSTGSNIRCNSSIADVIGHPLVTDCVSSPKPPFGAYSFDSPRVSASITGVTF